MRHTLFLALTATTTALVAQAPAAKNLTEVYAAEAAAIDGQLKQGMAKEAFDRLVAATPAEMPAYNKPTLDQMKAEYQARFKSIFESMGNYTGMAGLVQLQAKCAISMGQWEKGKELLTRAQSIAKTNRAEFEGATKVVRDLWAGLVTAAEEFKSKNAEQAKTLEAKAQDPKTPLSNDEKGWLDWYKQSLPIQENNIVVAGKINSILDKNMADLDKQASMLGDQVTSHAKRVEAQTTEIETFNKTQSEKTKKKVEGNGAWVTAVCGNPDNFPKGKDDKEMEANKRTASEFLQRLLVLDPGNKAASGLLENLKAGRELFPKKAEPAKGAAKGKKGKKG